MHITLKKDPLNLHVVLVLDAMGRWTIPFYSEDEEEVNTRAIVYEGMFGADSVRVTHIKDPEEEDKNES